MSLKLKTKILDLLYPQGLKCAVCKKEAIINGGACEACRAKLRAYDDVFIPAGLEGFTARERESPLRELWDESLAFHPKKGI